MAPVAAEEIAPGVHLLAGTFVPGTQPDGNSVVFVAPAGLVVVDTGRHATHTQRILDFAAAAELPVQAVVNTHWHLDHIGGNRRLREAFPGAQVYASGAFEAARAGFLARYRRDLEQAIASEASDAGTVAAMQAELALLDAAPALIPDEIVTATGVQVLAGRQLTLGLAGPAVTTGDVWVFDPLTRVLVAGDLVTLPVPLFDTACPAGWEEALGALERLDFRILIPGHGLPMDRAAFEAYCKAFQQLLRCGAAGTPEDSCAAGWRRDAGSLVPESEEDFARSLLRYYVANRLRPTANRAQEFCGE